MYSICDVQSENMSFLIILNHLWRLVLCWKTSCFFCYCCSCCCCIKHETVKSVGQLQDATKDVSSSPLRCVGLTLMSLPGCLVQTQPMYILSAQLQHLDSLNLKEIITICPNSTCFLLLCSAFGFILGVIMKYFYSMRNILTWINPWKSASEFD